MNKMISIIITAYKEEKTIGKAIDSILSNEILENYELLVLAPDKPTLDVVRSYQKKSRKIIPIKDSGKGKPSALNMAFKQVKGEYLILTDGDVYISKKAIQEILKPFKDKKIGAVSGRPISLTSRKTMLGFWSHLLTDIAHKRRLFALKKKKRFYCSGYLFAMRRGIVDEIPEDTLSDDGFMSHMVYSKKYGISYNPGAEVYVQFPTNLKDWIKQKRRSAGGYNQIRNWTNVEMRSFSKESLGILQVLKYPKTMKEFFWTLSLVFMRVYLWTIIFLDINLRKKEFKKIWVRVDSTK